jgi:hypothetical protein
VYHAEINNKVALLFLGMTFAMPDWQKRLRSKSIQFFAPGPLPLIFGNMKNAQQAPPGFNI